VNGYTLPAVVIAALYVAFVAIIAVTAFIATEHDRGLPRKSRGARGSAPHA